MQDLFQVIRWKRPRTTIGFERKPVLCQVRVILSLKNQMRLMLALILNIQEILYKHTPFRVSEISLRMSSGSCWTGWYFYQGSEILCCSTSPCVYIYIYTSLTVIIETFSTWLKSSIIVKVSKNKWHRELRCIYVTTKACVWQDLTCGEMISPMWIHLLENPSSQKWTTHN